MTAITMSRLGEASGAEPEGTPLCPGCLRPVESLRYYCPQCGFATGTCTQLVEFVNIRWWAGGYGVLWRRLWFDREQRWYAKAWCFLSIVFTAPAMLVGLPFVWSARRRARRAAKD